MSQESSAEDALSPEELSEVLAEATGTTAEEIERGAEEMEFAPPEEATVVDDGELFRLSWPRTTLLFVRSAVSIPQAAGEPARAGLQTVPALLVHHRGSGLQY